MEIFIVKHCTREFYIASNKPPRLTTDKLDKAFRFGTRALAETARRSMKIPIQWEVLACDWDSLHWRIEPTDAAKTGVPARYVLLRETEAGWTPCIEEHAPTCQGRSDCTCNWQVTERRDLASADKITAIVNARRLATELKSRCEI